MIKSRHQARIRASDGPHSPSSSCRGSSVAARLSGRFEVYRTYKPLIKNSRRDVMTLTVASRLQRGCVVRRAAWWPSDRGRMDSGGRSCNIRLNSTKLVGGEGIVWCMFGWYPWSQDFRVGYCLNFLSRKSIFCCNNGALSWFLDAYLAYHIGKYL